MRVKIQHSVNIDDVEDKIADLLSDSISHLDNARTTSGDLLTLIGIKASHHKQKIVLDLIHNIREQLTNYDNVLSDISNIVGGLHDYHESLNTPPIASSEEVQEVVNNITERFSNMPKDENNVNEG